MPIGTNGAINLLPGDLVMFQRLRVGPELLERARIERVDNQVARSKYGLVGSSSMDLGGIVFPYLDPLTGRRHTARVRRDKPEIENDKPKAKYLSPFSDRKHLYLIPGATELINDIGVPVILTESEKSTLALTAWAQRVNRRVLPVGCGGCWGWRGRIGRTETAHGDRVDEVGVLPELATLCSEGRVVYVLLDANATSNSMVHAARSALVRVLRKQKAIPFVVDLPAGDGINGPDDYIGLRGDLALATLFDTAKPSDGQTDFSDDALALEFTAQYGDDLQYVAAWGRWYRWTGALWDEDETLHVKNLAREVCRKISIKVEKSPPLARKLLSAPTIAAVEQLVRSDRCHAATVDQWDADLWLLNTPAGAVDLRTDTLRPAARTDYCTKSTSVAPGGETSECPLWLTFLDRITAGDVGLQGFLQRVAGYSLTGWTREDAMFFLYGTGRNGKGVFLNTMSGILADYAKNAPVETFMVSQGERHPTDLAMLRGARLVTASETEDGKRWAESRIKGLTGGDPISARFMRQDYFEFTPQFKLVIAGNHKPSLRGVDEAMRARFHLVPFTVTIPKEERDKNLPEKLRTEWPAILRWAIDGCLAWQHEGLNPPPAVLDATEDYLAGEDTLGRWLIDRCVVGNRYQTRSSALFEDFKVWAEEANEFVPKQKAFSQNLQDHGFGSEHSRNGTVFNGLALRADIL